MSTIYKFAAKSTTFRRDVYDSTEWEAWQRTLECHKKAVGRSPFQEFYACAHHTRSFILWSIYKYHGRFINVVVHILNFSANLYIVDILLPLHFWRISFGTNGAS